GLGDVGGLARATVGAPEAVRGLTGDRRSGLDEGAPTLVRFHEPRRPELSHCLADRARRDAIAFHQHGLTRDLLTRRQSTTFDLLFDVVRDLEIPGLRRPRPYSARHSPSMPPMLMYMSNSTGDKPSTPLHSVSVAGAVIREDGRMLVIKRRDNGNWEPPGGVLELDETPEEGVVREVLEETGIHVEVDQLTGVYKNMTRGIVALVFRCKLSSGVELTTSESMAVEWRSEEHTSELQSR